MESFYINSRSIEVIKERGQHSEAKEGFKLFVLDTNQWDQVSLLWPEHDTQQTDWIKRLQERDDCHPRFERLSQNLHYICFIDIDEQRNERPIRCFLTPNVFVLMGWDEGTQDRVTEWAERGILPTPLELASAFGLRVLRHHQKRLDKIEDQMDLIEEEILIATHPWHLKRIIVFHRQILELKRSLNAHQRVFVRLKNIEKPSYGDLQEELIYELERVINNVHQAHEMIESLREAYQAAVDNRSNEIMKLLTLVATIILPISLLTGFFGMNFQVMPFLNQPNGIFMFYGLSVIIILVVTIYFWKKKWLK